MPVTRRNQGKIFHAFSSHFVTAVLGPRRVGKTTFVEQFIGQHKEKKWVSLNMDIRADRQRIEDEKLLPLIEERALQKLSPQNPLWIAIDEAQKCPPLFEQIKVIYDRFKGTPTIKFILTGSGFLSLHKMASESLAGRIELYFLREFGLREAASLKGTGPIPSISVLESLLDDAPIEKMPELIDALAPHRQILQEGIAEQLIWGGLPEVLERQSKEERLTYLRNYLQTYLEKDVRDIETITDLNLYEKMMEVIAQQTGSVRDDQRLVQALGCSRDTLKKYRGYLEATLVYLEIFPFIGSSLKRLVKSPKGYLNNNGLISYLSGLDELHPLESSGAVGHRFENWILKEILIALDRISGRGDIYFWRTSGNVEVDFVIEKKPFVLPVEVTYGKQAEPKKIKHLKQFLHEEKEARFGLYIYNGDFNRDFSVDSNSRIVFLPAWAVG